jgi:hypothetical protein
MRTSTRAEIEAGVTLQLNPHTYAWRRMRMIRGVNVRRVRVLGLNNPMPGPSTSADTPNRVVLNPAKPECTI